MNRFCFISGERVIVFKNNLAAHAYFVRNYDSICRNLDNIFKIRTRNVENGVVMTIHNTLTNKGYDLYEKNKVRWIDNRGNARIVDIRVFSELEMA